MGGARVKWGRMSKVVVFWLVYGRSIKIVFMDNNFAPIFCQQIVYFFKTLNYPSPNILLWWTKLKINTPQHIHIYNNSIFCSNHPSSDVWICTQHIFHFSEFCVKKRTCESSTKFLLAHQRRKYVVVLYRKMIHNYLRKYHKWIGMLSKEDIAIMTDWFNTIDKTLFLDQVKYCLEVNWGKPIKWVIQNNKSILFAKDK
jgi:hypothetical protein